MGFLKQLPNSEAAMTMNHNNPVLLQRLSNYISQTPWFYLHMPTQDWNVAHYI